MSILTIDGISAKQLEAARESLISLYEMKEEYAKAKSYLTSLEKRMAQHYDTVNRVLQHIKESPVSPVSNGGTTHG